MWGTAPLFREQVHQVQAGWFEIHRWTHRQNDGKTQVPLPSGQDPSPLDNTLSWAPQGSMFQVRLTPAYPSLCISLASSIDWATLGLSWVPVFSFDCYFHQSRIYLMPFMCPTWGHILYKRPARHGLLSGGLECSWDARITPPETMLSGAVLTLYVNGIPRSG